MQQAAIYVRDPLIIPGSIISKEVKERRKTVKGVWLRDDVTGQLWHFPDAEYEPVSGAVLNDD